MIEQVLFDDDAPFWMVWCPTGNAPTVKHPNFQTAKQEAERLARANPGRKFHVLESKGMCAFATVQWTPVDPDWVPF